MKNKIIYLLIILISCATVLHKPADSVVDFDQLEKSVDKSKTISPEEKEALKAGIKAAKKQDEQKSGYIEKLENKVEEQQEKNEKKSEKLIDVSRKAGEADKSDKNMIFLYVGMAFVIILIVLFLLWKFGNFFDPSKKGANLASTVASELLNK